METQLVISKNILFKQVRLDYYLTTQTVTADDEEFTTYGVQVQKVVFDRFGVEHRQKSTVGDICSDREQMFDVIKVLCDNDVMPVGLYDVICDRI